MIEVYREKGPVIIPKLQGLLEEAGIETFIRNESLSSVEVRIPDFFPALCIVDKKDLEQAKAIIEPSIKAFH